MSDEKKQYGLKKTESILIEAILQKSQELLSLAISTVIADRLAVNITKNTKFEIAPDFSNILIFEVEPEDKEPKSVVAEAK